MSTRPNITTYLLCGFNDPTFGPREWEFLLTSDQSEIADISPFMNKKLRAVRAYRSQSAVVGFVDAVRGLNRYRGEMHSWPDGDYAEVFARLKT